MNSLQIIEQRELLGKDFKIYGDFDNPLFLGRDVAEWIDYAKTGNGSYDVSKMLNTVDENEKLIGKIFVSGQNRDMWFLTEDGLYEVLMQSTKPIAKEFKKQVKEILKSIRKNGMYAKDELLDNPDLLIEVATRLKLEKEKVKQLQQRVIEMKPKEDFYDAVTQSNETCDFAQAAKILNFKGIGRNKLFEILRDKEILRPNNQPYQKYVDSGWFKVVEVSSVDRYGDLRLFYKTVIYQKGLDKISKILLDLGYENK
nr:MAG TPA: KilAC domain protein [Caudoviricetes sp.]